MNVIVGVLVSFAAALLFFVFEPVLLGLDENWRRVGAGVVFFVVVGIIAVLRKFKSESWNGPHSIGARNEAQKDLNIEMDKVRVKDGSRNIASDNKSGGKTTIKISDSDL